MDDVGGVPGRNPLRAAASYLQEIRFQQEVLEMSNPGAPRRRAVWPAIAAVVAVALGGTYAMAASSRDDAAASRRVVVKTARNATLGTTILVTTGGRSLYSLSAETHGRFICTDSACRSVWKPLVVARGTTPAGTAHLATVKRPDGRTQVTYRGLPLYTFTEDRKTGDVKGNGFKDVGTWRVATASGSSATAGGGTTGGGTTTGGTGGGGYGGY
jgi:predicted lipoprotein with Yx(FWY)xxD motif